MDKVNSVNLTINDAGKQIKASDVNVSNIRNYIDGIPNNDSNFVVTISDIKPYDDKGLLYVNLTFTNPLTSEQKTITYQIYGFVPNKPEINDILEIVDTVKPVINDAGKKVTIDDVGMFNVENYVDGLQLGSHSNGVNVSVSRINRDYDNNEITITVRFYKNSVIENREYKVSGFLPL